MYSGHLVSDVLELPTSDARRVALTHVAENTIARFRRHRIDPA